MENKIRENNQEKYKIYVIGQFINVYMRESGCRYYPYIIGLQNIIIYTNSKHLKNYVIVRHK